MESNKEEIYTLIIPVKPEKDQPGGYIGGHDVGEIKVHKEHLEKYGGVFWSWGFSNSGIRNQIKNSLPLLLTELGKNVIINGNKVKIDNIGYFYSSINKSFDWKFKASSIKKKKDIQKSELQYIPKSRCENHYKNENWDGDWMLITELTRLKPFKGEIKNGSYIFPQFEYKYFSNPKNDFVEFTTNHLTQGNAFVIGNMKVEK